jgi:hypothetical protein
MNVPYNPAILNNGKGKAIPLQVWTGPEVSGRLSIQDLMIIHT